MLVVFVSLYGGPVYLGYRWQTRVPQFRLAQTGQSHRNVSMAFSTSKCNILTQASSHLNSLPVSGSIVS